MRTVEAVLYGQILMPQHTEIIGTSYKFDLQYFSAGIAFNFERILLKLVRCQVNPLRTAGENLAIIMYWRLTHLTMIVNLRHTVMIAFSVFYAASD